MTEQTTPAPAASAPAGGALLQAVRDLLAVVDDCAREIGHRPSGYYLEAARFDALRRLAGEGALHA